MAGDSARSIVLPRIMRVRDLAEALGVSVQVARSYLRTGTLPGAKVGGRWLISREAVVARIEELSVQLAAERHRHRLRVVRLRDPPAGMPASVARDLGAGDGAGSKSP